MKGHFFAFILLVVGTSAWGVDDKIKSPFSRYARECVLNLKAVPIAEVVEAAKQSELSPDNLKIAENRMMSYVQTLPIFEDSFFLRHPILKSKLVPFVQNFSLAVSARVAGADASSDAAIRVIEDMLRNAGIKELGFKEIRARVIEASEDPEIYRPFSMASFIMQKQASLEAVFMNLHSLVPGVENLEFPSVQYRGPFAIGPRQMEMVRSALQYSQTRPEDHMLDIGYGTPSALLALSYFTRASKLIGIDPFILPEKANEVLKVRNIELLEGLFPDDGAAMARIKERAPYSLIMALDTLKRDTRVLETSQTPLAHAKALYDLLAEGGVAVIMNDFNEPPQFTEAEARKAGLNVVRWNKKRPLPPALRNIMPYYNLGPNEGVMGLTVLRKGIIRQDRVTIEGH